MLQLLNSHVNIILITMVHLINLKCAIPAIIPQSKGYLLCIYILFDWNWLKLSPLDHFTLARLLEYILYQVCHLLPVAIYPSSGKMRKREIPAATLVFYLFKRLCFRRFHCGWWKRIGFCFCVCILPWC